MNFLRRAARYAGVPEAFVDDAVQDIIVNTWLKCPDGQGWYLQAKWSARAAAERYGTVQRKRKDRRALEQVRITTMEVLELIPQDQWWIVEKTLDFRAAVQELSPVQLKAVELIAQAEQGSRREDRPKTMSGAAKQALYKARKILRVRMA